MDESHRLINLGPMDNYDVKLFNQIYKDTELLRNKLAFEIDSRKFGVDFKEMRSWFDVKLLYAFIKYQHDPKVKGYCINALRTYKSRIIINSYQSQYQLHDTVDIDEVYEDIDYTEPEDDNSINLLNKAKEYLKSHLSPDAFFILEVELNPPPYIIEKLKNSEQIKMPKIPSELLADFLDINTHEGIEYIDNLRYEIKQVTANAREHFSMQSKLL
jgi:hypothetical protein